MSLIKKMTVTVTKVDGNQYEIQELTPEELADVPKTYGRDNTLHFSIKNGPKPKIKYEEIISINGVPVDSTESGGESKNTDSPVDPSTLPEHLLMFLLLHPELVTRTLVMDLLLTQQSTCCTY